MAKKIIAIIIIIIVLLGILAGWFCLCYDQAVNSTEDKSLHVVILDSDDFFYTEAGIEQGIKLAMEDIEKNGQYPITYELIEDDNNYVKGLSLAKSLSEDPNVDIVITTQNFDSIDAEIPYFEKAQKPFIVTMGCYDQVAEQEYDYLITDFINAHSMGEKIGQFLIDGKSKNIALCHSDTMFERDTIRGMLSVLNEEPDVNVYYSETGPFDEMSLGNMLTQYKRLNIDTVVANFYMQEDSEWLLSRLYSRMPELTRVGDYVLDNSEVLSEYGKYLEGVYMLPNYPYEKNEKMDDFIARYEKESGTSFTTTAIQYYDLFMMFSTSCDGKKISGTQMMERLKSKDGYKGVGSTIRFDQKGCLIVDECPMFRCHDSVFSEYKGGE